MRFFKHFTTGHSSTSMTKLMNQFGLEGYAAYFILIEMCVDKMDKARDEEFTEIHCKFRFSERLVREKLRMRSTKVELFLNYSSTLDLLQFVKLEDELHFYIPKLLEYLDKDTKRARPRRGLVAANTGLDIEEDKEIEKELDKELGQAPKATTLKTNFKILSELQGYEPLDQVLMTISTNTQKQWLTRYKNSEWVKQTLSNAVDYYSSKANGEAVTEWPQKLITWLSRDKTRPANGETADAFSFLNGEESA